MNAALHVCEYFGPLNITQNGTDKSIFDIITDISSTQKEVINECTLLRQYDCGKLFQPILSEEGICFTYNALNSRDIYTDA